MNVLVTGATGFVGSNLCRGLLARGHQVRAFHRPSSSKRLLEGLDVEHALGDITQPETIEKALEGIEAVFHAAAWMGGQGEPGRQYAVTVEGTRNLLQAASRAGVRRVVHTSSVAAMGVPQTGEPGGEPALLNENHTWNFRPDYYSYGYAKYLAEQEVQKAVAGGLDVVIVNPSLIFGPGDIYRQAGSIITLVAERRLSFAVEGGINAVHIDDVVDGHIAALKCGQTGERYILAGTNLTHLQLLEIIAEITGVPAPNLVLPGWLVRSFSRPAKLLNAFLNLPASPDILHLAGYYFFYDRSKSAAGLSLEDPRPVKEAISEAYRWFNA